MKLPCQTSLFVSLVIAVIAVAGAACFVSMRQAALAGQFRELDRQREAVTGEVKTVRAEAERLSAHLVALTNALQEARFLLEEERKTNEPLRRQVEKMLAQEITSRVQVEKMQEENRNQAEQVRQLQVDLNALRNENAVLQGKLKELGTQQQVSVEQQNLVQGELQKSSDRMKQLEKELSDTAALQAKTRSEMEAAVSARDRLQKELEEVRQKAVQPAK